MLSLVILAGAMYVCPGNVFSDVEKPGCKPFTEERGTVSIDRDTPQSSAPSSSTSSSNQPAERRNQPQSSVNEEMCAMYKEYVDLQVKTQGGFQTGSVDQTRRWQTLKRMFQGQVPPDCP